MKDNYKERVQVSPLLLATKPTLLSLRKEHDIALQTLADAAGVSLTDVYVMQIGEMVQQEIAVNVLRAFSELTGKTYSLQDISVRVKKD